MAEYLICKRDIAPTSHDGWTSDYWSDVKALSIKHFHPRSSDHRPRTEAKVTYTPDALHLFFRVQDRYVRCVRTQLNDSVCLDSCVEFFVQPRQDKGYFNFEINCGGTMLASYIEDHRRTDSGFAKHTRLSTDQAGSIAVTASMPQVVEPEIVDPTEWTIRYSLPISLLEQFVGPLGCPAGRQWRANFYKCGDETSHPHWASWSPIGEELNFHLPQYFAPIRFAE
jgi:hypothetical protein